MGGEAGDKDERLFVATVNTRDLITVWHRVGAPLITVALVLVSPFSLLFSLPYLVYWADGLRNPRPYTIAVSTRAVTWTRASGALECVPVADIVKIEVHEYDHPPSFYLHLRRGGKELVNEGLTSWIDRDELLKALRRAAPHAAVEHTR